MSIKYDRRPDWKMDLTARREKCNHCKRQIAVVNNRFVNHGPAGSIFQCPNSGTVPAKQVVK